MLVELEPEQDFVVEHDLTGPLEAANDRDTEWPQRELPRLPESSEPVRDPSSRVGIPRLSREASPRDTGRFAFGESRVCLLPVGRLLLDAAPWRSAASSTV